MRVACPIRPETNLPDSLRHIVECVFEDPEQIVAGRDIAVSELGMNEKLLFCPLDVERLVGLVPFIAEERLP